MKKTLQIPFTRRNDEMLTYAGWSGEEVVMKDNYQWEDTLVYESFGRGRSAVHVFLRSVISNKRYVAFMSELSIMIPFMNGGIIVGKFTFCKKGMNYSIHYIGKEEHA